MSATWKFTGWTGKETVVEAPTMRDAYVALGYPADPEDYDAHLWEEDGSITNQSGDFVGRIEQVTMAGKDTTLELALTDAVERMSQSQATVQAIVKTAEVLNELGTLPDSHLRAVQHVAGLRGQVGLYWFEEDVTAVADRMMEIRVAGDAEAMEALIRELQLGVGHVNAAEIIRDAFGIVTERMAS